MRKRIKYKRWLSECFFYFNCIIWGAIVLDQIKFIISDYLATTNLGTILVSIFGIWASSFTYQIIKKQKTNIKIQISIFTLSIIISI